MNDNNPRTALAVGATITTVEEIRSLPKQSTLLCRVGEIFYLAPLPNARIWFAPGYDPARYEWDDDQVASWAPLTLLHIGGTHWSEQSPENLPDEVDPKPVVMIRFRRRFLRRPVFEIQCMSCPWSSSTWSRAIAELKARKHPTTPEHMPT